MKIVHVFSSLDFGGVETRATTIAKYSNFKNGALPVFCAISKGGQAESVIMEQGCKVEVLNASCKIPSLKAFLKLLIFFRQEKPDVVHAHGAEANFHGILAAYFAGVPVRIGEEIGIPVHSKSAKRIFKFIYFLSSHVVAISDSVKAWLIDSGEVPLEKVTRIYNPVEIDPQLCSLRREDSFFKIGFVGRLEEVKNPLCLIRAVSILKNKGVPVQLVIVGAGSQLDMCQDEVVSLGIENNVRIAGFQQQPLRFIRDSDLYVQPSLSEGFGIAIVEAMGCGLPVLATSVGGVPEIIQDGVNGWIMDDPTDENIAQKIIDIMRSKHHLHHVGDSAKQSVAYRFSPKTYLENLNALYSSHFFSEVNNEKN